MRWSVVMVFLGLNTLMVSQNKVTYTYAVKDSVKLEMDVYTPIDIKTNDSLPVVLWMHGGGFEGGQRDNLNDVQFMHYLTENGFIGISISYRLLLKDLGIGAGCDCPKTIKLNIFRQATIDYLDAAKYVISNKDELRIDPNRIIAGGSSAGAEGVLSAAYLKHFFVDDTAQYDEVKFAGAIALAGAVVDADYITKDNAIPTVLFHGTDDNLVPFGKATHHYCSTDSLGHLILDGSQIIADKLHNLGTSYYFHQKLGGGHELAEIPFSQLDAVFNFFKRAIHHNEIIQTTITIPE
ncbi:alpha/beta hydrolase [Aestuariivivens sediminicola]|uniref:alpha/beta hydrolase n=1 Tax=Aestuariivivens sediminicola TaxID=2913560 RepID=UPI001F573874|nr:alpha/beta hydrolase [Aestuariivivens sediminicola]